MLRFQMNDTRLRFDSLIGNRQRLDGGSMFGNAPKALWSRWASPDDQNRIDLACRCLLVRDGTRTILCEAGIGAFFEPAMRERFGVVEPEHRLLSSLAELGIAPEQVDVVVLSHLHFDHAGGILSAWQEGRDPELVFPRAHYVVGKTAWDRALRPHPRDRASFIPGLCELIRATGHLELVGGERSETLGPDYRFHASSGHTPGMILLEASDASGPLLFAADLIPGLPWLRRAITMGYDRFPELLIDEKTRLLDDLCQRNGRVFFTHDPEHAVAALGKDAKGEVVAVATQPVLRS
ncbi:MAG: MBL fold metallo-hydrolase [Planctomycetota bacterium]